MVGSTEELTRTASPSRHAARFSSEHDRDYFGQTVNLASRAAGVAEPGEVVVTEAVALAAANHLYRHRRGHSVCSRCRTPVAATTSRPHEDPKHFEATGGDTHQEASYHGLLGKDRW